MGEQEEGERRADTIIALSYHCTVINSPARWGVSALAGAGPMMNHLHPALAIYDREANMSRPGNQLGLVFGSHCHRVTISKWGHSVTFSTAHSSLTPAAASASVTGDERRIVNTFSLLHTIDCSPVT